MTLAENTITCPLCGGSGRNGTCPECNGAGKVANHFAHLVDGHYETAEETAAAECRPVEEVRKENDVARQWIKKNCR